MNLEPKQVLTEWLALAAQGGDEAAFRGRHRALMTFTFLYSLVIFGCAVWTAVRFYQAGTVQAQLQWGGLTLLLLLAVMFIKVWFWMEMQSNRILRELKRVELLLVSRPPAR